MSTPLLQVVQVLAVEDRTVFSEDEVVAKKGPVNRATRRLVTLMVTPEQARAIQLATACGSIQLVLRNPTDQKQVSTEPLMVSSILNTRPEAESSGGAKAVVSIPVTPAVVAVTPTPTAATPPEKVDPPVVVTVAVKPAVEPKVEPKTVEKSVPTRAKPATWDVTVIRGSTVETQKFEVRPGADKPK
jgi:hypothetical protein